MTPSFSPAVDQLATPLAWTDAQGVLLGANPALARWLGVGQRRLPGVPLPALEADGQRLADWFRSLPDREPARLRRVALAFPGQEAVRFADVSLSPVGSGSSEAGWLFEAHPVEEFPGEDPAVALPSALSAALKGLAHELRNPLAGLKGAAQLLGRRIAAAGEDPDARELVALIDAEVGRLTALLDRLLSPIPARPHEAVNIHAVLERVLRLAEADAGWAVKLVRDYDPSLPPVQGDPDRLTQAVWNLVRNAIEAGAAHVVLRTRAEHGARLARPAGAERGVPAGHHGHDDRSGDLPSLALRLDIGDDGRGVPEELAERVFLPLVSGRAEGTGLGLALAQQVAREHGGSLVYRSRPGHTVFTLLLPMAADGESPPE